MQQFSNFHGSADGLAASRGQGTLVNEDLDGVCSSDGQRSHARHCANLTRASAQHTYNGHPTARQQRPMGMQPLQRDGSFRQWMQNVHDPDAADARSPEQL
eukprot:354318-Chlamydomonas_euryale.AAC.14